MNRSIGVLTFLGVTILLASPARAQEVIWSDEFDTGRVPDPNIWSYDLGNNGWGNHELQEYTRSPDNVKVENGNLVLTAREIPWGESDTRLTSGRIRTQDKLTFTYGTIEARIKVPDLADGLWPAFWTLGSDFNEVGWPQCGEIDIMEMGSAAAINDGVVNRRVSSVAHWDNLGSRADYGQSRDAPADLTDDFHIYRMDWTPTRITTYLDGQQIWTFHIEQSTCADCSEFHQPHFLILNLAIGGNYTGRLTESQITAPLPAEMRVDYIRIIDNGHTKLGGTSVADDLGGASPAYSGSWYNENQSGHGFSIEFGRVMNNTPTAVVYWYNYDVNGNPLFFIGTGEPQGNNLTIEFVSPHGMVYGEFDPDTVKREDGGTGVFEFQNESNATFSFTPSDFSSSAWGHTPIDSLRLVKLFSVPASSSAVHQ